jgi:excisionase family DNA binding protein
MGYFTTTLIFKMRVVKKTPELYRYLPIQHGGFMDKLVSFKDAEALTDIKVQTWRAWAAQRKFPVVRLGRRVKIRESDLQKLIEPSLVPAAPERTR